MIPTDAASLVKHITLRYTLHGDNNDDDIKTLPSNYNRYRYSLMMMLLLLLLLPSLHSRVEIVPVVNGDKSKPRVAVAPTIEKRRGNKQMHSPRPRTTRPTAPPRMDVR